MVNLTPDLLLRFAIGLGLFAFGWTLFRFGLNAAGFCLGYLFGSSAYELVLTWVGAVNPDWLQHFPQHPLAAVFVGVVIGIVGILLAKRMYQVMVFLGSLAGALYVLYSDDRQRALVEKLFEGLHILEPINRTLGNAWPAVLALLIALAVLYFQKRVIVILTASMGAYIITDLINVPIAFLPLCFVGYLLQTVKVPKHSRSQSGE